MATPEMPEFEIHPKDPAKTYGFKDFMPKPVGRVMPFEYGEEEGAVEAEVETPDPKASSATESADSSAKDSNENLSPEEVVARMNREPLQKQPSPSTPELPNTLPVDAEKVASKTGS